MKLLSSKKNLEFLTNFALQFERAVTFTKYIQPLDIAPPGTPTDNTNPPSFAGELCNTVGWGFTCTYFFYSF